MGKNKKVRVLRASFTVEAALIMTILLPVLVSLIYAGFFVHDRALLQGAACEIAVMGSNLAQEEERQQDLQMLKDQLVSSRLLGTTLIQASVSVEEDEISASYRGSFSIPGLTAALFGNSSLQIGVSWSKKICHPASTIRRIRGLSYMVDSIRG